MKSKRIKAPEDKVLTSSVFTGPPANVYGIKGGHDKAVKCMYMYYNQYGKHLALFLPRCMCPVFCLWNKNSGHL